MYAKWLLSLRQWQTNPGSSVSAWHVRGPWRSCCELLPSQLLDILLVPQGTSHLAASGMSSGCTLPRTPEKLKLYVWESPRHQIWKCTALQYNTRRLTHMPVSPQLFRVMLLQVSPVPKSELLGVVVAQLLQIGRLSCHPRNFLSQKQDRDVDY